MTWSPRRPPTGLGRGQARRVGEQRRGVPRRLAGRRARSRRYRPDYRQPRPCRDGVHDGGALNEAALDHYQIRKHGACLYRHVTLAICALAWLAVAAASWPPPAAAPGGPRDRGRAREGVMACGQLSGPPNWCDHPVTLGYNKPMICLTMNEIRRLHAILRCPAHPPEHHLRWSAWRRRHQGRTRHCHYQRRRARTG